jgi:hypothetical protein
MYLKSCLLLLVVVFLQLQTMFKIHMIAYLAEVVEAHSSIQELPVGIQHLRADCPVPQLQLPVLHIVHQRSGLAHVVLCSISLLQGD